MQTSKMYERINWYKKEYVFENYSRIVDDFKDYDKISKKKMLESIYKVYSDYHNIIDISTTKELKYLEMVLNNKNMNQLNSEQYEWERNTLTDKFLLQSDYDRVFIPDEIIDNVKEAITHVDFKITRKKDYINEIAIGFCKILGLSLFESFCSFVSSATGVDEKIIKNHLLYNKLFHYYVMIYTDDYDGLGKDIPTVLYQDYYSIKEELKEERNKQAIVGFISVDLKRFKTLFYNDFDIHNKKINKFLIELKKLPFFWFSSLDLIRKFAMLNIDREPLKESFRNVIALKNYDLTDFFKVLDEAMDEMPSGALYGLTPNEAKLVKKETEKIHLNKEKNYIKQQNANLSKQDSKLFYKIYFGLLDFTNKKYKIKNNFKIYGVTNINPYQLRDIIDKFWENKNSIIQEFCSFNPYNFNHRELTMAKEFIKGIRGIFIIFRFEKEYTVFMSDEKAYMVKGLFDNIDKIISYQDLPMIVITSIIPFNDVLVYDGLLLQFGFQMGNNFIKVVEEQYLKSFKYYHL